VNAAINLWVPYNVGNFLTSCGPVGMSGRIELHGEGMSEKGLSSVEIVKSASYYFP